MNEAQPSEVWSAEQRHEEVGGTVLCLLQLMETASSCLPFPRGSGHSRCLALCSVWILLSYRNGPPVPPPRK